MLIQSLLQRAQPGKREKIVESLAAASFSLFERLLLMAIKHVAKHIK